MSVKLAELKSLLATMDVRWKDVGSSNPSVANGYFERVMPDGTVLRAMVYLHDKDAPLSPDLERHIYRRLAIVGDVAPMN
jgi:hypothetical protein